MDRAVLRLDQGRPQQKRGLCPGESQTRAVRARIGALTNRLGDELKERDTLSARLRETELVIAAKRRRLDGCVPRKPPRSGAGRAARRAVGTQNAAAGGAGRMAAQIQRRT